MMEGRGGCCIAPYTAGVYDMSKVDRIMLRYRPIAPKPAAGGSVSGGSSPDNSEANASSGRGKRKYVKQRGKKSSSKGCRKYSNKRRKSSSDETETGQNSSSTGGSVSGGDPAVTLPLLPETPDRRDSPARGSPNERQTIWLNFGNNDNSSGRKTNDNQERFDAGHVSSGLDRTVVTTPQPTRLVGSIVTVESVAETWVDAYGLGWKDEERMRNLEEDTCPGFVSDGYNRVGWTNGAYREMVGGEVVVWLVMKERVPITYPAFTCKVKVQYTCGKERCSVVVPCDAWKMDGGGFAWRLDVKAALSLGR